MILPDEKWIADGVAMVSRLREQGHYTHAAEVARFIELRAMPGSTLTPDELRDRKNERLRTAMQVGCSVRDCHRIRMTPRKPWCCVHRVRFDLEGA